MKLTSDGPPVWPTYISKVWETFFQAMITRAIEIRDAPPKNPDSLHHAKRIIDTGLDLINQLRTDPVAKLEHCQREGFTILTTLYLIAQMEEDATKRPPPLPPRRDTFPGDEWKLG